MRLTFGIKADEVDEVGGVVDKTEAEARAGAFRGFEIPTNLANILMRCCVMVHDDVRTRGIKDPFSNSEIRG